MPFDAGAPLALWPSCPVDLAGKPTLQVIPRRPPGGKNRLLEIARAQAAIIQLGMTEELLGNGENWLKGCVHDGASRYCLSGALTHIGGDDARLYLTQAIEATVGRPMGIAVFNDSRKSFADIRAALQLARDMAQEVVNGYGEQEAMAPQSTP